MFRVICLALGYLIGCVQIAYFVGRSVGGIDIREHGSGSAGTTNITRILGKKAGIAVFIADVCKGVIAFFACALIFNSSLPALLPGLYGGLGAVIGHCFPFYLKFKGGKGVATSLGVILCISIPWACFCYVGGLITLFTAKYMSLASMVVLSLFPVAMLLFAGFGECFGLSCVMTGVIIYQHRGNIERLIHGTEPKFIKSEGK